MQIRVGHHHKAPAILVGDLSGKAQGIPLLQWNIHPVRMKIPGSLFSFPILRFFAGLQPLNQLLVPKQAQLGLLDSSLSQLIPDRRGGGTGILLYCPSTWRDLIASIFLQIPHQLSS